MSSFGAQMRKRFEQLRKAGENVPKIMAEVAEGATIAAVETAVNNTPPNGANISGTNTRSGEMAQSWQDASVTTPTVSGGAVSTVLANGMQYASYVNDGHRMDKHFVPGLTVADGMLQKTPADTGIMVGTKTTYVPGIHMKEKAVGKYRTTVRAELDKRVREAFK
jgi:hypothetical protein